MTKNQQNSDTLPQNAHCSELTLRIDWSELDVFAHVNNLAIMKYIQSARFHYCESIGLRLASAGIVRGPVLAANEVQFLAPLFYPGTLTLRSRITEIGNSSMRMEHLLFNDTGTLSATARDVVVYYDFLKKCKMRVPDSVRERINAFQSGVFDALIEDKKTK